MGDSQFVSGPMLLVEVAAVTCIGNVVVTHLFLREIRLSVYFAVPPALAHA